MSVNRRIVVTGLGLCTPLGIGVKTVWRRLLEGGSGIVNLPQSDEYKNMTSQVVGLVPRGSGEGELDEESVVSSSERRKMALGTIYALCATEEALTDAQWRPKTHLDKLSTGVSIGTCMPDLDAIITTSNSIREGKHRRITPYFIPKILCNLAAGHVGMRYGLKGPNHSVSTACATGLHSIGDASAMIARGIYTAATVYY